MSRENVEIAAEALAGRNERDLERTLRVTALDVVVDVSRRLLDPVEYYLHGVITYGSPERVIDELQRLREEMFLDYLLCAPLSHSSFMMFTEKVLPCLL